MRVPLPYLIHTRYRTKGARRRRPKCSIVVCHPRPTSSAALGGRSYYCSLHFASNDRQLEYFVAKHLNMRRKWVPGHQDSNPSTILKRKFFAARLVLSCRQSTAGKAVGTVVWCGGSCGTSTEVLHEKPCCCTRSVSVPILLVRRSVSSHSSWLLSVVGVEAVLVLEFHKNVTYLWHAL